MFLLSFEYIDISKRAGFESIFIMTYANIPYSYGIEKFVKDMKAHGVTGLIVPDLPIEDEEGFYQACFTNDIIAVPVAVINMKEERIQLLKSKSFKHLYVSLRVGITGQETVIDENIKKFLEKFKDYTIYAGFGIRNAEQVKALEGVAQIAVVGSYFTNIIKTAVDKKENMYEKIKKAMQKLKNE
jgi:tryptophan synthase alpha chain